jgi:hypothetical protein
MLLRDELEAIFGEVGEFGDRATAEQESAGPPGEEDLELRADRGESRM